MLTNLHQINLKILNHLPHNLTYRQRSLKHFKYRNNVRKGETNNWLKIASNRHQGLLKNGQQIVFANRIKALLIMS